jgi:hypothetical protein
VDPISVRDPELLHRDVTECTLLAEQARGVARKEDGARAGKRAIGGAIVGAAAGAAIGGALGDSSDGAAIGATAGAVGGASGAPQTEEEVRQAAIGGCLRNRGYMTLW